MISHFKRCSAVVTLTILLTIPLVVVAQQPGNNGVGAPGATPGNQPGIAGAGAPAASGDRGLLNNVPSDCLENGNCSPCDLLQVLANGVNYIFGFAGAVALLMLLWNAFGMVTSAGNEEKVKGSQEGIWRVTIGMFFVLIAWQFTALVLAIITNQNPGAQVSVFGTPWNAPNCSAPAGGGAGTDINPLSGASVTDVKGFINVLIKQGFLPVIGAAAFFVIILAGNMIIRSRGNSEAIQQGTKAITWAIIGLVITFGAYIFISFWIQVILKIGT